MKKMYISPRMETIVITSNIIATSGETGPATGVDHGDFEGGFDAPVRGGRWE